MSRRIVARFDDRTRIVRISNEKESRYELLSRGGKFIGGVCTYDNGAIHIDQLFVEPDYWRRGYATRLMNQVLEIKTSRFTLDVVWDNEPALALYHKLGFKCTTEHEDSDGLFLMEKKV